MNFVHILPAACHQLVDSYSNGKGYVKGLKDITTPTGRTQMFTEHVLCAQTSAVIKHLNSPSQSRYHCLHFPKEEFSESKVLIDLFKGAVQVAKPGNQPKPVELVLKP